MKICLVLNGFYGHRQTQENLPKGYATAYQYGEHSFYFAIAYHSFHPQMGIIVKFSAQALDYYCNRSLITVYQFMQKVQHKNYMIRLSRIDFTADYIDEEIDVTEIYQTLIDKKVGLYRECIKIKKVEDEVDKKARDEKIITYRRIPFKLEGYIKGQEVPTIYLGSVQSSSRLRIYDKKREQIERKGTKYDKAIQCNDWVRFEGTFRKEYAHQISGELLYIHNNSELANLVALTLGQKYRFRIKDEKDNLEDTYYTQLLLAACSNNNFKLRAPTSRNFDLARSITYLVYGSGTMNTLYKIKTIWNMKAVEDLFAYMSELLAMNEEEGGYKPNGDNMLWLKKNLKDYQNNYPDFDTFYNEILMLMLEAEKK